MHASSLENMRKCHRLYVEGAYLESRDRVRVIDIGGADVNGSYRDVFKGEKIEYLGVDIAANEGVAVVLDDPYRLPFEDGSVDVVVSGQMLEHCEFFWLTFAEMARVLAPDGMIILIAPSAGPIHRYPVDCYRFYPDAYAALARYAGCRLVDVWRDDRGPWQDLVGVFQHADAPELVRNSLVPEPLVAGAPVPEGTAEEEVTRGGGSYLDALKTLHARLEPAFYLEIGVRNGRSLALARCPAVGVDPFPEVKVPLGEQTRVVEMASDDFFDGHGGGPVEEMLSGHVPELVFIDGMHLFEYVLRDFMNAERRVAPGSLIVIDDVFPGHPSQAARDRRTRVWTGDVWKLHDCLKRNRPDLVLLPLDVAPTGLLLIAGLNPADRTLWDRYNPLVRRYTEGEQSPPQEVLERRGVVPADSPVLATFADTLRDLRAAKAGPGQVRARLGKVLREQKVGA